MKLIDANCIVLSAGEGKRMNFDGPKVLCEILFKPMIDWVLSSVSNFGIRSENTVIIVGYQKEKVIEHLNDKPYIFFEQKERLGTADAVKSSLEFLQNNKNKPTLVLCGDAPFIDKETLEKSYHFHIQNKSSVTVITSCLQNPYGYGRIIKDKDDMLLKIVEEKDLTNDQKNITEINSGAYWFDTATLIENISKIRNNNNQKEYYLTDIVSIFRQKGFACYTYKSDNEYICYGANTKSQLFNLTEIIKRKINLSHLSNGVEFIDINNAYIGPDCIIENGTKILPNTILKGKTTIASHCEIGPNTVIEDSEILDYTKINASQVYRSSIGKNVKIGPFSHIRPNSKICDYVKIGDFVEIKNSVIDQKTSIAHLSYIGDSDFGKNINVGCGVVTVNYDGKTKNKTIVEDNCFIGCNSNLISPITIKENAYIAAGSTITQDVEKNSLAIARKRQINIYNWVIEKFKK